MMKIWHLLSWFYFAYNFSLEPCLFRYKVSKKFSVVYFTSYKYIQWLLMFGKIFSSQKLNFGHNLIYIFWFWRLSFHSVQKSQFSLNMIIEWKISDLRISMHWNSMIFLLHMFSFLLQNIIEFYINLDMMKIRLSLSFIQFSQNWIS